jgi:hypothetical protein
MLVETVHLTDGELLRARMVVRRALLAHGCPDDHVADVVSVVNELLTAIVETESQRVELRLSGGAGVTRFEIEDHFPEQITDVGDRFRSHLLRSLTRALGTEATSDDRRVIFAEVALND